MMPGTALRPPTARQLATQNIALSILRVMDQPYAVRTTRPAALFPGVPMILTGLDSADLHGLQRRGLITASMIYLGGKVSADLTVLS